MAVALDSFPNTKASLWETEESCPNTPDLNPTPSSFPDSFIIVPPTTFPLPIEITEPLFLISLLDPSTVFPFVLTVLFIPTTVF